MSAPKQFRALLGAGVSDVDTARMRRANARLIIGVTPTLRARRVAVETELMKLM